MGDIRVPYNFPSIAVDSSGSADPQAPDYNPNRGRIYIVAPHHPREGGFGGEFYWRPDHPDESDVVFVYSKDRGATWENVPPSQALPPTQTVNDDGTDTDRTDTDQFMPNVAVDNSGRVAVSWYDRRPLPGQDAPPNWEITVWAAISSDGGETFGENFQVSDVAFPPARTNPNTNWLGGCYMGLYNGIAGGDDEFLLAWGDNRDHVGPLSDMNVYFDRVALG